MGNASDKQLCPHSPLNRLIVFAINNQRPFASPDVISYECKTFQTGQEDIHFLIFLIWDISPHCYGMQPDSHHPEGDNGDVSPSWTLPRPCVTLASGACPDSPICTPPSLPLGGGVTPWG